MFSHGDEKASAYLTEFGFNRWRERFRLEFVKFIDDATYAGGVGGVDSKRRDRRDLFRKWRFAAR